MTVVVVVVVVSSGSSSSTSSSSSSSRSNSTVVVLVEAYTHTFDQGMSAGLRPLWLVKSQIVDHLPT